MSSLSFRIPKHVIKTYHPRSFQVSEIDNLSDCRKSSRSPVRFSGLQRTRQKELSIEQVESHAWVEPIQDVPSLWNRFIISEAIICTRTFVCYLLYCMNVSVSSLSFFFSLANLPPPNILPSSPQLPFPHFLSCSSHPL